MGSGHLIGFACGLALAVQVLPALADPQAGAAPSVEGRIDAVNLDAGGATLDEVLTALGLKFDLRYRSSIELNRRVSGSYRGSLDRLLPRLLQGYSFVVKTVDRRFELTVFSRGGVVSEPPDGPQGAVKSEIPAEASGPIYAPGPALAIRQ